MSTLPVPTSSVAVPWSTDTRIIGNPRVTFVVLLKLSYFIKNTSDFNKEKIKKLEEKFTLKDAMKFRSNIRFYKQDNIPSKEVIEDTLVDIKFSGISEILLLNAKLPVLQIAP